MATPIIACKVRPDYRVWVRFEDGIEGEVNMRNLIEGRTGAFALLRRGSTFEDLRIEQGCLTWGAGVRLDPDVIYDTFKARGIQRSNPPSWSDLAFCKFFTALTAQNPDGSFRRPARSHKRKGERGNS